ncbi:hypothetical protein [Actinophytocola algeriensis]|uniref:ABC-2 type transport system permease protein n=1 Tax=Actinophytocola algeriensis TaxID=1768010 RepID=A0A7W7PZK6_9PSEU|nr:hypothetical protein [Actinophytocola algeriensis]MBB4904159.1 hypothetical protein [Actinophytocola algeriensis]MBE1476984.1 hypothetical protein [Actinophytocola algeriensis]
MTARWPLLRVLLTSHVSFLFILWLPAMLVSAAILAGVALWGTVDQSIWHYVATQVPRWVVLGLGVDAATTYLRLNLAHGRTRRDFLRQLWPYLAGLAVALAAMITIAYQIERGAFAMAGWHHRTPFATLFGDTGNVLGLLGVFTLMFLLWSIAGAMIAAGFTRNILLGFATIPLGLLIVAPSEVLVGLNGVPLFDTLTEPLRFPLLTAVAVCLGGAVVGCAATWGIVRDIPVRAKVA